MACLRVKKGPVVCEVDVVLMFASYQNRLRTIYVSDWSDAGA
jgi:hypothetical protein